MGSTEGVLGSKQAGTPKDGVRIRRNSVTRHSMKNEMQGGISTASLAGMGTKNALDGMSRKSTAMSNNQLSEHGTPAAQGGQIKRRNSSTKRKSSTNQLNNSQSERGNLIQGASHEVLTLSLDPKAGKKKKPRNLDPLPAVPTKKITGNIAAEVLKELEEKEQNKKRNSEMRLLDREVNQFLNFNSDIMALQMNNAFEGKKEDFRDKMEISSSKVLKPKIMRKESGKTKKKSEAEELDPILEVAENARTGQELVLYKPDMSLSDQRKMKNQELKNKVKLMIKDAKLETES